MKIDHLVPPSYAYRLQKALSQLLPSVVHKQHGAATEPQQRRGVSYKAQGATWGQGCEPVLAESSLFRKIESQ